MKSLQRWINTLPPILLDAALATLLGVVGAAQLVSRRAPFQGPVDQIRHIPRFPGPEGGSPPRELPGSEFFGQPPFHEADTLTYILLACCAASLLLRRRFPLLTLGGVTLFGALYLSRGEQPFSVQLIILVAMYGAVADSALTRTQAVAVGIAAAGVLGLAILYADIPRNSSNWAMDAAWVVAAIFLGDSVRSRRAYAAEAERGREEEARRLVTEERLQIARELHDVVGHNISLINVQAGAGEHVLYKEPAGAREAFANIRNASHETLQELRSMVGVLRDSSTGAPETAPTQGLQALDQLIKAVTDAGQEVELSVSGRQQPLPGVVDLSAYRILQEALTNTVRHAPHSRVHVAVDYGADAVSLEVTNERGNEPAVKVNGDGHGLAGMRERITAIGGKLDAGPQPGGGFRVRAVLPIG